MYTTYLVNSNTHMIYRYLHLHVATFQQHACLSIDTILLSCGSYQDFLDGGCCYRQQYSYWTEGF